MGLPPSRAGKDVDPNGRGGEWVSPKEPTWGQGTFFLSLTMRRSCRGLFCTAPPGETACNSGREGVGAIGLQMGKPSLRSVHAGLDRTRETMLASSWSSLESVGCQGGPGLPEVAVLPRRRFRESRVHAWHSPNVRKRTDRAQKPEPRRGGLCPSAVSRGRAGVT